MKTFLKFIGWTVALVMGVAVSNWLFGLVGELITTKNSFAAALGLFMGGVILGTWAWVGYTVVRKLVNRAFKWQDDTIKGWKKDDCCQNDCGCDRNR